MSKPDYNNPEEEERWCGGQRRIVAEYLQSQRLEHGSIGEWPAWHIAPCVAIWAIESLARPGWIGWWAISGDLPTDYISSADVEPPQHPRKAMRVFARNWLEAVKAWNDGREVENWHIGEPAQRATLAPLLEARARILVEWATDDVHWLE